MPDLPPHTSVKTYSSDFQTDENPVSEGGIWINGLKEGIDWADCVVSNGRIHGGPTRMNQAEKRAEQATLGAGVDDDAAAPEGDYDDPTAVIRGEWGTNQYGKGIVVADNPTDEWFQEVEIRLRTVIEPNWCRGYEIFFRCLTDDLGYAEIVRWNGKIKDWTSLQKHIGPRYGVKTGDVVEATAIGNVLKGYINGVEVITATDDVYSDGLPGVGFNFGVGDTGPDTGFSHLEFDTWDD
jgi:hypothetical protein